MAGLVGKLDEVFLSVKDLNSMRRFYTETLGLEEEFHHAGEMDRLRTGGAALVLKASKQSSEGVSLIFGCAGIEDVLQELSDQGVTVTRFRTAIGAPG